MLTQLEVCGNLLRYFFHSNKMRVIEEYFLGPETINSNFIN